MVRIQESSSTPERLLAGSDLIDTTAAARELQEWAARNGYLLPRDARRLTVLADGAVVREWVVLERCPPAPIRRGIPNPFAKRTASAV